MKQVLSTIWILALLLTTSAHAADQMEPCRNGPVHEAYITRVTGSVALDSVPLAPPNAIREQIPTQVDQDTLWIGGYWAWMPERNDYVWVSGVWRRPPPGQQWIDGFWKQYDEGWVWIRGFWSSLPPNQVPYNSVPPPDSIDENVQDAPGDNFFWAPGYWQFNPSTNDYGWIGGSWEQLDPNWVLVPSFYLWRPEGYVFVASFWDWPLDQRGSCYSCVFIPPSVRTIIEYTPVIILEPLVVVQNCFSYYPDYLWFFCHHYHYNHEYWTECGCTPPWWGWSSWWCYPWHDQWGLCWWYGHPGYPAPSWMSVEFAAHIAPPSHGFLEAFGHVHAPLIVTPNGVVPPSKLMGAINQLNKGKGNIHPIVPVHDLAKLQTLAAPKVKDGIKPIRPTGPQGGSTQPLNKVWIDKDKGITGLHPANLGKRPETLVPKKPTVNVSPTRVNPNINIKPPINVHGTPGSEVDHHVNPSIRPVKPPLDIKQGQGQVQNVDVIHPRIPIKPIDTHQSSGQITPTWPQQGQVHDLGPTETMRPRVPIRTVNPSQQNWHVQDQGQQIQQFHQAPMNPQEHPQVQRGQNVQQQFQLQQQSQIQQQPQIQLERHVEQHQQNVQQVQQHFQNEEPRDHGRREKGDKN